MTTYGTDGWRVVPAGVQKVATDIEAEREALASTLKPLPDTLGLAVGFAEGTSPNGIITAAVNALSSMLDTRITDIAARIPDAVNGAVNATVAVLHGDEQMATSIQTAAATAFDPFVQLPNGKRIPR